MKYDLPDIDIDFPDRDLALNELMHVSASIIKNGEIKKHNTGVFFQDIPTDPITNLASIDHETAQELGYFKIDFLNIHAYEGVKSNKHLDELCRIEPDWNLLKEKSFVDQLFHLSGNFDIVRKLQPKTIEQLAVVIAIKLPCKRYLIDRPWSEILQKIWLPVADQVWLKKSHSTSYATLVMVQMNLISEKSSNFSD